MGSPWLPMGPHSVRMKCTAPKKIFKHLPGPPRPVRRGGVVPPFGGFFKMRRVALWIHYFDEFVMFWRVALWLCFGPGRVAVCWRVLACLGVSLCVLAFPKMRARCAQDARALAQDARRLRKMVARCAAKAHKSHASAVSVCVLSVLKVA